MKMKVTVGLSPDCRLLVKPSELTRPANAHASRVQSRSLEMSRVIFSATPELISALRPFRSSVVSVGVHEQEPWR